VLRILAVLAAFFVCGHAVAQEPAPPTLEEFLSDLDFWSPELSPSGRYMSGVRRVDGEDFLVLLDLDNPAPTLDATNLGDFYIRWVDWISDDRLLVALTGYVDIRSGRNMSRQELRDWNEDSPTIPRSFSRLASIERETGKTVAMFQEEKSVHRNFSLTSVTDMLPDDPDHILMPARLDGDLDLFKVNVTDGTVERIATGTRNTYAWYTDRNGEPAFRLNKNARGTVIYIYAREDRKNGSIKWRKIRTVRLKSRQNDEAALDFQVLYPGPTETTYYVSARPDDEDKAGIHLYDFERDEIVETVRKHEKVDIEDGFFNTETRELVGVFYYDDRLVIEMDDPLIQSHLDALDTYFGNEVNVIPLDSSEDGKRWLLKAVGPREPGSYHIYNLETAGATELGNQRKRLNDKTFGATDVVTYTARDGLELRGYLTRPPMAEGAPPPPLVVMPHGGPEMRDMVTFDQDVQILVARGYQVFQPNFRGSSGFGKAFADMGRRQWGRAMQTDVEDGFDHLVAEGLAEADRACIFGYSYGGYAAMAAATLTPEKYQCVIAAAGVSDLLAFLRRERREEGSNSEAYQYWVAHIGHPGRDKETIKAVSPVEHAGNLSRPLLILHGKDDGVVDYEQAERMDKALRKAGKFFRLVTLENSSHSYMPEEDELTYYTEILAFLETHLPVN